MKTINRICVVDCTIETPDGDTLILEYGKEYATFETHDGGAVGVLTDTAYWHPVPADIFAVG